jgi:hypothetical protein
LLLLLLLLLWFYSPLLGLGRKDKGIFTKPLPSNDKEIHIQTQRLMGGIYKYTVEMGSGSMIYVPSIIKNGSDIQKFMGGRGDSKI